MYRNFSTQTLNISKPSLNAPKLLKPIRNLLIYGTTQGKFFSAFTDNALLTDVQCFKSQTFVAYISLTGQDSAR